MCTWSWGRVDTQQQGSRVAEQQGSRADTGQIGSGADAGQQGSRAGTRQQGNRADTEQQGSRADTQQLVSRIAEQHGSRADAERKGSGAFRRRLYLLAAAPCAFLCIILTPSLTLACLLARATPLYSDCKGNQQAASCPAAHSPPPFPTLVGCCRACEDAAPCGAWRHPRHPRQPGAHGRHRRPPHPAHRPGEGGSVKGKCGGEVCQWTDMCVCGRGEGACWECLHPIRHGERGLGGCE